VQTQHGKPYRARAISRHKNGYPLRKIVRVLMHARHMYDSQLVELECGHQAHASATAAYRARCRHCAEAARTDSE
jgi:hypothetical protein